MNIRDRAKQILSLEHYNVFNPPAYVGFDPFTHPPREDQYVLRMLIKKFGTQFIIPKQYEWVRNLVQSAYIFQKNEIGIEHSFCYLTIRNGLVTSVTDDEWHVDGFSMNINHIPEQNYIWSDCYPTEYLVKEIKFHPSFDPKYYNIHQYIQDSLCIFDKPKRLSEKNIYCLDSYVIHRRPKIPEGVLRCFVRISFCPIEIIDINNTINPLLAGTCPTRDGVKEFRDKLKRFVL